MLCYVPNMEGSMNKICAEKMFLMDDPCHETVKNKINNNNSTITVNFGAQHIFKFAFTLKSTKF